MKNQPPDWKPPYKAYSSPVADDLLTVAVLGAQAADPAVAHSAVGELAEAITGRPGHLSSEQCSVLSDGGSSQAVLVTYWDDRESLESVLLSQDIEFVLARAEHGDVGVFIERFTSPRDHFEVNSSTPTASWGIAARYAWVDDSRIGYWGASRDRIDAAEDGGLPGLVTALDERRPVAGQNQRIEISIPGNASFIRTVQGWKAASDEEREHFLKGPYRAYRSGVEYLQTNPVESKCVSARLLSHATDRPDQPQEETQAWFLSLADMEQWVWHSPTHGQIMKTFAKHAERFGENIELLLSHEVYVVPPGGGRATYVNCSQATGFLGYFGPEPIASRAGEGRYR